MTPLLFSSLAIIIFAAVIHASFQLSISVLTLLSGHSLGKRTAHLRLLRLMYGFLCGVMLLTGLLLSALVYYLNLIIQHLTATEQLVAAIVCGLLAGLGIAVWAFYYRRGEGTALWLPRPLAAYLTKRSKVTRNATEAFALGMASVIAELLFIIAPLLAAALAIVTLPTTSWQLIGIGGYILLSLTPLAIIVLLVGGGHSVAQLQAWREQHKRFMQFAAGGSLLVLACYLFVDRVLGMTLYGGW